MLRPATASVTPRSSRAWPRTGWGRGRAAPGIPRRLGVHECYVADLDAIQGGAVQRGLIRQLAEFHTGFAGALLVDAGTSQPGGAFEVLSCGASEVVVGLETLQAFADLAAIVEVVGPSRVVFSLDLRLGQPDPAPGHAGRGRRGR